MRESSTHQGTEKSQRTIDALSQNRSNTRVTFCLAGNGCKYGIGRPRSPSLIIFACLRVLAKFWAGVDSGLGTVDGCGSEPVTLQAGLALDDRVWLATVNNKAKLLESSNSCER